jgi:MFS transporter
MIGGSAADRLGRRKVFLTTMASFVVLAIVQAFATSMWELVIIRFLLGIPLGSDIATGYTYIMKSMPKGKREVNVRDAKGSKIDSFAAELLGEEPVDIPRVVANRCTIRPSCAWHPGAVQRVGYRVGAHQSDSSRSGSAGLRLASRLLLLVFHPKARER